MLSVEPIKAFTDNYIWLVSTNEGSIVIDPGESKNIQKLIDNKTIDLKGILITHHHYDHTNGLSELVKKNKLEVFGPFNDIDGINHRLIDKDKVSIIGIDFEIISIPGHTLDHIGFYSVEANNPIQADLELVRIMQIMIKLRKIKDIALCIKESFFTNFANAIGNIIFNHAPA